MTGITSVATSYSVVLRQFNLDYTYTRYISVCRKFPTCVTTYEGEVCMCVPICQRTLAKLVCIIDTTKR